MSCHGCAQPFGFLKKELGCPKCGFSYCKKCLRFTLSVKEPVAKELAVCKACYEKATKPNAEDRRILQKMESLDAPRPPIVLYQQPMSGKEKMDKLKRGMSEEDKAIAKRLENLKDFIGELDVTSKKINGKPEADIEARLARLKGINSDTSKLGTSSSTIMNMKPETEDELIARLCKEVELDKRYEDKIVCDIQDRLDRLKGSPNPVSEGQGTSQTIPMSKGGIFPDQDQHCIEQYGEEGAKGLNYDDQSSSEDEDIPLDELCRICDEKRATLLCKECDDDIFCNKCWTEFHNELRETHKPTKISK